MKRLILLIALFCFFNNRAQTGFNNYYHSGSASVSTKINYINQNEFILTSHYIDNISGQQGLDLKLINNQGVVLKWKRHKFRNINFSFSQSNKIQTDISNSTMLLTAGSVIDTSSAIIFTSVNKITLDTNWAKYYYDGIYNYYINNVFKVKPNEIWFMGGRSNNYGYDERPVTVKTDTLGNILSIKEFTAFINQRARPVFFDPTNNLVYLAGNNYSNQQTPGFVACVDTIGNVIWNQQNFGGCFFSQVEKKNNYLVLSGIKSIGVNTGLLLIKFNSITGNIIWQKTYCREWPGSPLTGFVINADESIVSVGSYLNPDETNGPDYDGIIFKVNSNGDSLWLKRYSNYFGEAVEEEFLDIQQSSDGGYVMCGAPFGAQNTQTQSWVVKTDSLGNGPGVVVPSTTTAIRAYTSEGPLSLFPNPAANQVMIEAGDEALKSENAKLMIYNTAGELIREEQPDFKNKKAIVKTADLPNGMYVVKLQCDNKIFVSKLVVVK